MIQLIPRLHHPEATRDRLLAGTVLAPRAVHLRPSVNSGRGQPWRNGYIESFNSRVRDECLNINMFWSLSQARVAISDRKADYNHRRRHSALAYQAPVVCAPARTHP
jgi:transposase InsO family protein